jgi:hypothetical protein
VEDNKPHLNFELVLKDIAQSDDCGKKTPYCHRSFSMEKWIQNLKSFHM